MSQELRANQIPFASLREAAKAPPQNGAPNVASILHDVGAFIRRYVVLNDDQAIAVTLWVAHTHAIEAADCTPYLQVTSATAEAGKTRLLETLELLVARPWFTGRTSAAALVRKIDKDSPTLLLDESDAAFNAEKEYGEALRGILNTGYRRSGRSTLCVGKDFTPKDFSTFCPKGIAGIGRLPDTVASRSIRIELRRRMKQEPLRRFRERDARDEAEPIRAALEVWAAQEHESLRAARPCMPSGLRDRAEDVIEPLLAVADQAAGSWPEQARRAFAVLMGSVVDQDINIELLYDIFDVFEEVGATFLPSDELAKMLAALDSRPWGDWRNGKAISTRALADRLKAFGIEPKRNAAGTARGYYRERFEDAWTRYPAFKPSTRQNSNKDGPDPSLSTRQPLSTSDASRKKEIPTDTRSLTF